LTTFGTAAKNGDFAIFCFTGVGVVTKIFDTEYFASFSVLCK
jgi:hypothetical protein